MFSRSLKFSFSCRNSFFILPVVKCSPLKMSCLWGQITYTISFIFALEECGRWLTSQKMGFTQIISLAQVCGASMNYSIFVVTTPFDHWQFITLILKWLAIADKNKKWSTFIPYMIAIFRDKTSWGSSKDEWFLFSFSLHGKVGSSFYNYK